MKPVKFAAAFAVIAMMTVMAAPVTIADSKNIDLGANILEAGPELSIALDVDHIDFGSLFPGESSDAVPVQVTNIGQSAVDVTVSVEDDGTEPLFVPGLLINDDKWKAYSASLATDGSDDPQLELQVPEDFQGRGDRAGTVVFWAEAAREPGTFDDWVKFQHDYYNSGVTPEAAPREISGSYAFATLTSAGSANGIDVSPVISGDTIYLVSSGGNVFAIDKLNGSVKWHHDLGGNFILGTPTVANGTVFAGTNEGTIAALDASNGTLLWSHTCSGQLNTPQLNTPIIYEDGYIYFGSWGGQYYCYGEHGDFVWDYDGTAFYWAGAAIVGNYIVFGSDGGHLTSLDKRTGDVIEDVDSDKVYGLDTKEIRSSLCYVPSTERLYFTSKAGYCYYIGFDPGTGTFRQEDHAKAYIGHSTSTPAVYNGRVYVGMGQFGPTGSLFCLDENTLSVIWNYVAGGGVQSSPVISTYYDDGDGEVYIYFTTNVKEGGLHCLKDVAGSDAPTVQFVYVPPANMGEYTLQGVAISDGMVYYGNDAGYLFALRGEA